jgi:protein O-mannosyl-transferase
MPGRFVLKSPNMTIVAPSANPRQTRLFVLESPQKRRVTLCLLLILATIALYNPISRAPFLNYDDDYYIIQNSHVRAGLTWGTVTWAFRAADLSNWHPVTWLSHALDVQLFGMNPAGHHYVNVLLHVLNTVLLFLLLDETTGMLGRSLLVAALFAVHPINVESVAWISERKNVLSMLFFLFGLIAYARYVRRPGIQRYLPVALCFALGLMAKPQVITFPFVLMLMDYWPLQRMVAPGKQAQSQASAVRPLSRPFSWLILEKLPLLVLSAASAVITMKVQTTAIHTEFSLSVRLFNAALAYLKYLGELIWPANLAPLYPHPGLSVSRWPAILSALVLAGMTVVIVIARERRYLLLGWFWFLGTLIPMIGIVQAGVQSMADRYAYIPFIGLFIAMCWGIADLLRIRNISGFTGRIASTIVLLGFAFATSRQIGYWGDNMRLWSHTLEVTRNNFVAEDSMAMALVVQGKEEEAMRHFQSAIRINPRDPVGNLNLGVYQQGRGNYLPAIAYYDSVFQFTGNVRLLTSALANRGSAYYSLKQYDRAQESFDAALRLFPGNAQALLGLGLLAQKAGDSGQAAGNYARSVQSQPTDVGYLLLAQALESNGQTEAARSARAHAERISPDLDRAKAQMIKLLAQ